MIKFVLQRHQALRRSRINRHNTATHQRLNRFRGSRFRGFTLTEVMIASVLLSVVILVAWTGFISALNMSQTAQAKTARQLELNTALDVMTTEVRRAQAINRSGAIAADGTTVTVKDVVASTGLDLDKLGPYGEIALYLELPTNRQHATCPTNDGPVVADMVDKVVYDVRPSPEGWLAPNAVVRYGRIPESDGSIDPCSDPFANDVMADSLADTGQPPNCPGVMTGSAGFHTCTQGDSVELLLNSSIQGLDEKLESRGITPRQASFDPLPATPQLRPRLVLSAAYSADQQLKNAPERGEINLTWRWSGNKVDVRYEKLEEYIVKDFTPWPYSVRIQDGGTTRLVHAGDPVLGTGINMRYPFETTPANACFVVEGMTPEQNVVESNQVCVVNGEIQGSS